MSALSILVNCIILCAALRSTYSTPKKIAVLKINKTDNILIDDTSYSSVRNPLKSYWNDLPTSNVNIHGTVCMCNLGMRGVPPREDYIYTPGIGSHKLHTRGQTWNTARTMCIEEGGQLAVVNSDQEARAMMRLFHIYGKFKDAHRNDEAFLGIHDIYKEGDWTTILGDPLVETGFTKWSNLFGGQPDNGDGVRVQNCGGFLTEGTLDDIACNTRFAFICEIPEITPL
ncbi:hemolymph lipopolysaccharide-binding protein-like [Osmia bicornis bicornis]|uniref:hemolymph lipopolysaccharide-binding protein-like n=1 Tax=Osmia bicornis bicornis TaxID=1437191 RepID=UPI0010F7F108|nr:hemolymph lipopolysaccharide-binding protein-like [Osmia bicornis bicornis]